MSVYEDTNQPKPSSGWFFFEDVTIDREPVQ